MSTPVRTEEGTTVVVSVCVELLFVSDEERWAVTVGQGGSG